jgi:8-oxo-dGTP pyrophosphatase MutT (NUDIX family)
VAFPGGGWEEGDEDLQATALREAREEVALPPERVSVLRELEWFETTLGHRVKPFVAAVTTPVELVPDPREVERVIYLPVALLRSQPFAVRGHYRRDPDGERHAVYTLTHDGAEIWGLTARILMRLVERMESDGTPERACAPKSRT